jgi:hypothetical protein
LPNDQWEEGKKIVEAWAEEDLTRSLKRQKTLKALFAKMDEDNKAEKEAEMKALMAAWGCARLEAKPDAQAIFPMPKD